MNSTLLELASDRERHLAVLDDARVGREQRASTLRARASSATERRSNAARVDEQHTSSTVQKGSICGMSRPSSRRRSSTPFDRPRSNSATSRCSSASSNATTNYTCGDAASINTPHVVMEHLDEMEDLATAIGRHAGLGAVVIHAPGALHAQLGSHRARLIVDARMYHAAVVRRLVCRYSTTTHTPTHAHKRHRHQQPDRAHGCGPALRLAHRVSAPCRAAPIERRGSAAPRPDTRPSPPSPLLRRRHPPRVESPSLRQGVLLIVVVRARESSAAIKRISSDRAATFASTFA